MTTEDYRRLNTRTASVLQIGGFRPTLDPLASNVGKTTLGLPGEEWPTWNAHSLMFVCQLNLTTAPAVPPLLADIKLITFFVTPEIGKMSEENGQDWCLRAYKSLEGLAPMPFPADAPKVHKGFECLWQACEDHPDPDDPELVRVPGVRRPRANFDNVIRTKIGGYVSAIQSEPWFSPNATESRNHPANPKYCLQINSEEKAGLMWGDGGTIYIARGTAPGCEDQWFLDWQSL